jgi:thiamine biosynthesis lipoprotein
MRFLPFVAGCAALLAANCARTPETPPGHLIERARVSMGTEIHLTAWDTDEPNTISAFDDAFHEFDRLDGLMTVWRDTSDIQRLNAAAGEHPVPVSPEVRDVLRTGRQVSEWTHGKFDVTFAALSGLWKFDQDQDGSIPDPAAIRERLRLINYRALEVDDRAGTAFLAAKGMRVNLGGIGKGYGVDRAVAILRRHGLRHFMVQAGGDMYASGQRGDRPWRIGIRDPRGGADQIFAAIDLSNGTFSTSGDYERAFIKDGTRYHHIIDPGSGEPARGCRSVTLITDEAVVADALATGVFVLGPADGMALIEQLPNVEGVIVTSRNDVLVSSGLRDRLIRIAAPTDAP